MKGRRGSGRPNNRGGKSPRKGKNGKKNLFPLRKVGEGEGIFERREKRSTYLRKLFDSYRKKPPNWHTENLDLQNRKRILFERHELQLTYAIFESVNSLFLNKKDLRDLAKRRLETIVDLCRIEQKIYLSLLFRNQIRSKEDITKYRQIVRELYFKEIAFTERLHNRILFERHVRDLIEDYKVKPK